MNKLNLGQINLFFSLPVLRSSDHLHRVHLKHNYQGP